MKIVIPTLWQALAFVLLVICCCPAKASPDIPAPTPVYLELQTIAAAGEINEPFLTTLPMKADALLAVPRITVNLPYGLNGSLEIPSLLVGHGAGFQPVLMRPGDLTAGARWTSPTSVDHPWGISLGGGRSAGGSETPLAGDGISSNFYHAGLRYRLTVDKELLLEGDHTRYRQGSYADSLDAIFQIAAGSKRDSGWGISWTGFTRPRQVWDRNHFQLFFRGTVADPVSGEKLTSHTFTLNFEHGLNVGISHSFYWQSKYRDRLCNSSSQSTSNKGLSAVARTTKVDENYITCPCISTELSSVSWGTIRGGVYDSLTGDSIGDAVVNIQDRGKFTSQDVTSGRTDRYGRYQCYAPLGKMTSTFNTPKIVAIPFLPLLFFTGPVTRDTKRVDNTMMTVRVTREGYQPFEGVVHCRDINPDYFIANLEPVLLARRDTKQASTAADGWGAVKIISAEIEPAILYPGGSGCVTVRLQCPRITPKMTSVPALASLYDLSGNSRLVVNMENTFTGQIPLQYAGQEHGILTLTGAVKVPVDEAPAARQIKIVIEDSPFEVAKNGTSREIYCQVILRKQEEAAAQLRVNANQLACEGEYAQANGLLQKICQLPEATDQDWEWLAQMSRRSHNYPAMVDARKHLLDKSTGKQRLLALGEYGESLLLNHEIDKALQTLEPDVKAVPRERRANEIPISLMVALGKAYLQHGDISRAQELNLELVVWNNASEYPETAEFRHQLRLIEAETAAHTHPLNAGVWAEYGRVLLDLERWEDAVTALQTSLKINPAQLAVANDLESALRHIRLSPKILTPENSDAAIAAAKEKAGVTGNHPPSQDYRTWQRLGILYYRESLQLDAAKSVAALQHCRNMLTEAVRYGRRGRDTIDSPPFNFIAARTWLINGFATEEAAADFQICRMLTLLQANPDDYLAWWNLADSFLIIGETDLAEQALNKCLKLKPEFLEGKYLQALIYVKNQHRPQAETLLREVINANPLHPHAELILARLYNEDGDVINAVACLADYEKNYGE